MTVNLPIYLDYMATTPVDSRVAKKMCAFLCVDGEFGNPTSNTHCYGWQAAEAIAKARLQVAALINANSKDIVWTSGATEANNLALLGAARFYQTQGKHIITLKTEHKAVLDCCKQLEREGFTVSYLTPKENGLLDLEDLKNAIQEQTILISVMHVNNEIGVIQDIQAIGEIAHQHGILFHVDAAQSAGKIPIDLEVMPVDLMSFSAHKIYGPKGIGVLFVRHKPRVRLQPIIHGGGHQNGMRSGTLPTHQIVGMGKAFSIAKAEMNKDCQHIATLRDKLWEGLATLPGIILNGDKEQRIAGNLNISVEGVEGESLIFSLKELAVSNSAACASANIEPSYVLKALGRSDLLAHSSIRLSLGRFTTEEEIDFTIKVLHTNINRLRKLSPL